jgi:hypothetical protein
VPLTKKGRKIERAMDKEYGSKKGKQVFYASKTLRTRAPSRALIRRKVT